jgi:hypothetical protein
MSFKDGLELLDRVGAEVGYRGSHNYVIFEEEEEFEK